MNGIYINKLLNLDGNAALEMHKKSLNQHSLQSHQGKRSESCRICSYFEYKIKGSEDYIKKGRDYIYKDRAPAPENHEEAMSEYASGDPFERAARWGHTVYCFGSAMYKYKDPLIDDWVNTYSVLLRFQCLLVLVRPEYFDSEMVSYIEKDCLESWLYGE
jgi:hypothetical protein